MATPLEILADADLRHAARFVAYSLNMLSDYVEPDDADLARYCYSLGTMLKVAVEEHERRKGDDE